MRLEDWFVVVVSIGAYVLVVVAPFWVQRWRGRNVHPEAAGSAVSDGKGPDG